MLKNEADAKDAAQQSMEKILSRASDYDAARPAMPCALAIAAWECRTILRRKGRRREAREDLALMILAALIGHRLGYTLAFGSALFVLGVTVLWYGQGAKRTVLPGLMAGVVPLSFALCAKVMSHACVGDGCMALCVPACAAGGVIAGVLIDIVCLRGAHGPGFWLAASCIGLFTGAMGCARAGVLGVAGLAVGFAASAVPGLVATIVRRRAAA